MSSPPAVAAGRPAAGARVGLTVALLAAPLLVAVLLAFWSLNFGLPYLFRPDEDVVVGRAVRMAAQGSLNPLFAAYPPLAFDLMALAEKLTGHLQGPLQVAPSGAYLTGRAVSALFFLVTVGCTFVAARGAYGNKAGLLAGTMVAVAPLAVRQAHFATTDMIQTALVAAALAVVAVADQRRLLLWGAALAGLAAATKYSGGLVLVAVLVAGGLGFGWRATFPSLLGVALAAFLALFLPLTPNLPDYARGLSFLGGNAVHRGSGLPPGVLFNATVTLPFGLGLGAFAMALAGVALAVWRRRTIDVSILAFVVAYYLVQGIGREDFFRYMLPLVPALSILASGLLPALRGGWQGVGLGLGLVLLVPSLYASVSGDRLLGIEDTRVEAAAWINAHVPPGASISSPYYGGPFYSAGQIQDNRRYVPSRLAASFAQGLYTPRFQINEPDPSYKIVASGPPLQGPMPTSAHRIVARFGAGAGGAVYDPLDSFYVPIWGFGEIERPGPSIVIVRLP